MFENGDLMASAGNSYSTCEATQSSAHDDNMNAISHDNEGAEEGVGNLVLVTSYRADVVPCCSPILERRRPLAVDFGNGWRGNVIQEHCHD